MAAFHIARSGISPVLRLRHSTPSLFRRRLCGAVRPFPFPFICRLPADNGGEPDGSEESPESLFAKELKRRGMTTTSLLDDSDRGALGWSQREMNSKQASRSRGEQTYWKGVASAEFEKEMLKQWERSMLLNSEGLEGLHPRAKLLLTLGATFFLGIWPLILGIVAIFAALYVFFGTSFVHDASSMSMSPPTFYRSIFLYSRMTEYCPTCKSML